ncbi:stage II sporulation protein D [Clostridium paridis]|uniref:Stage II sporulation protein D n=1 Tax=Clostridium paridis TaxID=2803863 RepID=A0A937K5R6_9CLOT|nr:stage II sporulation protein D [Clostridium paridis]MBL4932670.1 stage II sporulation protein D [Clostridium paridis]
MRFKKINIKISKKIIIFLLPILVLIFVPSIILVWGKVPLNSLNFDKLGEQESKQVEGKDFSKVTVYKTKTGTTEKVDLEVYVLGVLSGEMPAAFDEEALKAQAVAARTFAMKRILYPCTEAKGADVCDTVHCQVFMSKEDRVSKWDKDKSEEYWKKLEDAVSATKGKVLTYNGELVLYPQFFSTSWGKTEDAEAVLSTALPYLQSVDSPGEEVAPKFKSSITISSKEFVEKINNKYKEAKLAVNNIKDSIKIVSKNPGGSVNEVKVGGVTIKGTEFRSLLSLNSANFTFSFSNKGIEIQSFGYGHGVGMSQWGANVMAKSGVKYEDILKHYYKGIELKDVSEVKISK